VRDVRIALGVSSIIELYRAHTYEDKEPETLTWIERNMAPGDVLYDIGANIGLYSLYAAARGVRVYAFEPESLNFARLNRNIIRNSLSERVLAYCVGISDITGFDRLSLNSVEAGAALHQIGGDAGEAVEPARAPAHVQGAVTVTVDELHSRFGLPFPTHVKIDVDGLEARVVTGAFETLGDARLKSLLIEIQEDVASKSLVDSLTGAGLLVAERVETAQGFHNYVLRRGTTSSPSVPGA
jgi:FkbM family methyltransferase